MRKGQNLAANFKLVIILRNRSEPYDCVAAAWTEANHIDLDACKLVTAVSESRNQAEVAG